MVTKAEVIEALRGCLDPELNANIVDIGLIFNVSIDSEGIVKVTLTMTSPMCPVTSLIMADAQLRIEAVTGVKKAELDLVWDPLWNPEMMSEELKYTS